MAGFANPAMKWDEMAFVGTIARAHGLRGQVIVNPETDFPEERFGPGSEVFILRGGQVEPLVVDTLRFHHERPVIAFRGIDDIDVASPLAGSELRVPVDRLVALPPGTFYRHDLIGCAVETVDGAQVGTVTDVEGTLSGSRLVVKAEGGELLVPIVEQICRSIDPAARRIVIDPPAGLLEINSRG